MRIVLGGLMRNGARLEAVGIAAHKRLREFASPEFQERLHAALQDEERHVVTQRDLADRLWDGPLPISEGGGLLAHHGLHVESHEWAMVGLNLVERAFEFRIRSIARLARQMGYRFMHAPLMEIAADESRHVALVTDMLRATPRFPVHLIGEVAQWVAANEAADESGFFPGDRLIPMMA